MEKNYNDQIDLLFPSKPHQTVQVEGKTYHELTEAQLNALQALESGKLFAQEVKAQEYKLERWDFVQLAQKNGALHHIAKRVTSTAFQICLYMTDHISKDNNALVVTRTHLSKVFGISIPTVRRALAQLKKAKVFDTVRIGNQTAYIFNAQIVWKGDSRGRKYAFFNTSVIADYDEQEKETLAMWNDTSLEGGAPLSGKKNAEMINEKIREKIENKRRDIVYHLVSHQIDPKGYMNFEDQKFFKEVYEMPMNPKDPQWKPIIELWEGYVKKEPWAIEWMGFSIDEIEH